MVCGIDLLCFDGRPVLCYLHSAALPVLFTKALKDEEATEGKDATLRCELNKASAAVEWRKGHKTLKSNKKYQMRRQGAVAELVIQGLEPTDSGSYSCVCGEQQTTASLEVKGKKERKKANLSSFPSSSIVRKLE